MTSIRKGLPPIERTPRKGPEIRPSELTAAQIKKFVNYVRNYMFESNLPSDQHPIAEEHNILILRPGKLTGELFPPRVADDGTLIIHYDLRYTAGSDIEGDIGILGVIQLRASMSIEGQPVFTVQAKAEKDERDDGRAKATILLPLKDVNSKAIKALIKNGVGYGGNVPFEYFTFAIIMEGREIPLDIKLIRGEV